MTIERYIKIILFSGILALLSGFSSCNSKTEDIDEIVVTSANIAIKDFYLNANSDVLSNLDSVFFSIDLDRGVIYNADSLPKGTDVTHLLATITFANTMTKADLEFTTVNQVDSTINYLTNSTDSIDFTYPVKLNVTAADETTSFVYTIKVNVHNQEPDSIMWDRMGVSSLPSRLSNPVAQKTIYFNEKAYSIIEENNGSYTLSISADLNANSWEKTELNLPFIPALDTYCNSTDKQWILSDSGNLFVSENALEWEDTGMVWTALLGGYNAGVLGIKEGEAGLVHTFYPTSMDLEESPLEDSFPIKGFAPLAEISTDWYPVPIAFFAGGEMADGSCSSAVWAFDGSNWEVINESYLPAVASPMMAHYVVYREATSVFQYREFDAWLLFGGINEEGEFNRTVYYSMDNGVNWSKGSDLMQLPEDFPDLAGADLIVAGYELSANLSDAWNDVATKSPGLWLKPSFTLDGYDINWICPYLYVFGGYNQSGILSDSIWRGVLARLTFTPII